MRPHFVAAPQDLPPPGPGETPDAAPDPMRTAADYVAGLTDRAAIAEHRRLFATTPDLR